MSHSDQRYDKTLPAWANDVLSLFSQITTAQGTADEGNSDTLHGYLKTILAAEERECRQRQEAIESLLHALIERTRQGRLDPLVGDLIKRTLERNPSIYMLQGLVSLLEPAQEARPDTTTGLNRSTIDTADKRAWEEPIMDDATKRQDIHETTNGTVEPTYLSLHTTPAANQGNRHEQGTPPFIEQRQRMHQRPPNGPETTRRKVATGSFGLHSLQKTLERQLSDVIEQNRNFGTLLNVEQTTLKNLDGIAEIDVLRQILGNEIDRLLKGQGQLQNKLENALKYVRILESEGDELSNQLARAHSLSLTDELTNLPNRRAFIRTLEDEVARVQRYGYPLSLALLDLDHFKEINDKYGHAAGDAVLKCFSQSALSTFRHHDMLARYGGEEFAILLPNTDLEGAQQALQKVSAQTRKSMCTISETGEEIHLPTFSGGIASYEPGETPSKFIECADQALYQAKEAGRDRIVTGNRSFKAKASNEQPA